MKTKIGLLRPEKNDDQPLILRPNTMPIIVKFDEHQFMLGFRDVLLSINASVKHSDQRAAAKADYDHLMATAYEMLEGMAERKLSECRYSLGRNIRRVRLAYLAALENLPSPTVVFQIGAFVASRLSPEISGQITSVISSALGSFYLILTQDGDEIEIIDSNLVIVP